MQIFKTAIFRLVGIVSLSSLLLLPSSAFATEENVQGNEESRAVFRGKIIESNTVDCEMMTEDTQFKCFSYDIEVLDGQQKGEVVQTMPTWINNEDDLFKDGSKVYLSQTEDMQGNQSWSVESYSRENFLLILAIIFVVLIVFTSGMRGISATLGLIISFCTIYFFAIPKINTGSNFLLISVVTIFILLCASTFITYGFNIKSVIAFISTLFGIFLISIAGYAVISWLNISGTGEETSAMLFDTTQGMIRLSWVFLLSIVIGALGVLDDVTVGQASSMMEIYQTDRSLSANELFKKAMNIGKDHIASMVNTLFIAYAGSSFSLIMLLSANNPDFRILINEGFVVEEIVRTLVASIGIILLVPLTSFLASRIIVKVLK